MRYQSIRSVLNRAFKSCGVIASCLSTKKLFKRCQCIMFLSARKQFKNGGVIASFLCQQLSFLKGVNASCFYRQECCGVTSLCVCQKELKQFKSCGVDASCVCIMFLSRRSNLKVVVSMHYVFIIKKAV